MLTFATALLVCGRLPCGEEDGPDCSKLQIPKNLEEAQELSQFLVAYKKSHFQLVLILFSCVYVFKQTFRLELESLNNIFLHPLGCLLFGYYT